MGTKEALDAAIKEDLTNGLVALDAEIRYQNMRIKGFQKSIMDAETLLIEASVQRDKLTEQLYRLNASTEIDTDDALRDKQIAEFSQRLPGLLEKIK